LLYVFLALVLVPIWFLLRGLRSSLIPPDVRTDERVFFGRIRRDVTVEGGVIALRQDEVVDILEVRPQPGGRRFKYLVGSDAVGRTFLLDEEQIEVLPRPSQ